MNRTIKEATVKRFHDDDHRQPRRPLLGLSLFSCNIGIRPMLLVRSRERSATFVPNPAKAIAPAC